MTPKISVIVPVYKVEKYLPKCIDSILAQTFTDFELLLIDDGSPDNSGVICDEYAKKDSRIHVFHKENGGQSSARNVGLDFMNGEYVTFIDADDFISEDTFSNNIKIMMCEPEIDVVQYPIIRNYSTNEAKLHSPVSELIRGSIKLIRSWKSNIITNYLCGKIFRASIFTNNVRFPIGQIFEDRYLMANILMTVDRLFISDLGCYFYVSHPNQSVRRVHDLFYYESQIKANINFLERTRLIQNDVSKLRILVFWDVFSDLRNAIDSGLNDTLKEKYLESLKINTPSLKSTLLTRNVPFGIKLHVIKIILLGVI